MQLDPDRAAILITRDPHDAEDLVQDTYELILRRARELSGRHYMRAAATSTATASRAGASRSSGWTPRRRSARAGEGPDRRAKQAEVLAAIRALPEIHRGVLVTTYVAGATCTEAAAALGVKRATVMSRVFRPSEALLASLDGTIVPTAH